MSRIEIGLLVSAFVFIGLLVFFHFEAKRGARLLPRLRAQFDFLILKWAHTLHVTGAILFKRILKQVLHFVFHSLLKGVLKILRWFEHTVTRMLHANHSRARSGEYKNTEHNKLEEIALHKLRTALTDEEKQKHRESVLRGE